MANDLGVFLGFGGQRAIGQQAGEAQDAIDRGADFVAHVGQEAGLDAVGFLGALPRQVQLDVLDFQLFQRGAKLGIGLVNLALQILTSRQQGIGHGIDASFKGAQLAAGYLGHATGELAAAEAAHRPCQAQHRHHDVATGAEGEEIADQQPHADDQRAIEQHFHLAHAGQGARQANGHLAE